MGTNVDPNAGLPNQDERGFEVGMDEAYKSKILSEAGLIFSNQKRTADEYQDLQLEGARRSRTAFDKLVSDAQSGDNQLRLVGLQALQNAVKIADLTAMSTLRNVDNGVETANKDGKQATRHADIAIDNQWNPVQQGAGDTLTARAVSIDDASLKAISANVANTMSASLPALVAQAVAAVLAGGAPATK